MEQHKIQTKALFDSTAKHEYDYVIGAYSHDKHQKISNFLNNTYRQGKLEQLTYQQIYELIEEKLGYAAPLKVKE